TCGPSTPPIASGGSSLREARPLRLRSRRRQSNELKKRHNLRSGLTVCVLPARADGVGQAVAERVRRTQAERSAATKARLLDATIECVRDLGYARTTTPEIARRAGLSRGAQLHHYPTKAELVAGAIEHLVERRNREFREAFARVPAGADHYAAALDLLWSMLCGPLADAWREVALAPRADPGLRPRVAELTTYMREVVEQTFRDLFAPVAGDSPFFAVAPSFVLALLDGLAVSRVASGDDTRAAQVIDALKALARLVMPPTSGAP